MRFDQAQIYPGVAIVCGTLAAFTDIRSRRIPNWLTAATLVAGLSLHAGFDGWRGLLGSLAAGLIAGTIFLVFHLAGGMGAGDVKLIAGLGALVGLPHLAPLLTFTALAGGAMGIALALLRGQLKQTLTNVATLAVHHKQNGLSPHPALNVASPASLRLPYGVAIAAGCLLTFSTWAADGVAR